jgi:hypothetical protein
LNIQTTRRDPALIRIRVVVENGVAGIGLLDRSERHFLYRVPLAQTEKVQEVHIPVTDIHNIGRVVVQNWDVEGERRVRVLSLEVFTGAVSEPTANQSQDLVVTAQNGTPGLVARTSATVRKMISVVKR